MDKIIIRRVKEGDARAWVLLRNAVWRSSHGQIYPKEVFDKRDREVEERIKKFKERINESGYAGYVATVNDKIIGFADGVPLSHYNYYKKQGYAELMAVYVNPKYNHRGAGRALAYEVCKQLKKLGPTKAVTCTLKDNRQARLACEKAGGVLDAHEEYFIEFGKEYPTVFYLYDLSKIKTATDYENKSK